MTRKTGTVKFFCDTRGYGFIRRRTAVTTSLCTEPASANPSRGDLGLTLSPIRRVTFALEEAPKGPKAVDVSIERPRNANRAAQDGTSNATVGKTVALEVGQTFRRGS